jgi:heme-degrading monooxygenase HmoA
MRYAGEVEQMMNARVTTLEVPLDRLDEDIRHAADLEGRISDIRGSKGLYYLVDRETGHTLAITLWESEDALRASETAGEELRRETTTLSGGKILSVERYEVVAMPAESRHVRAA